MLVPCPECNRNISSDSNRCPGCGLPSPGLYSAEYCYRLCLDLLDGRKRVYHRCKDSDYRPISIIKSQPILVIDRYWISFIGECRHCSIEISLHLLSPFPHGDKKYVEALRNAGWEPLCIHMFGGAREFTTRDGFSYLSCCKK